MRVVAILLSVIISLSAKANIQQDLTDAFNSMNFNVNVNDAYASQQAGYYSGGSLYARAPVRNQQIAYINLPKISAGCGGIDIFTGGISVMTKEEAVKLAKEVMSNGTGFAFNLALETASPLISNNMKDWVRKIQQMTNQSINSCEMATSLIGAVAPKTQESQRAVCQSIAGGSGAVNDYVSSRMECKNSSRMSEIFEGAKKDPAYNKQLIGSMNFAWKAIRDNGLFNQNQELSELMMSLSGTIIYQDETKFGAAKKIILPSLASSSDFITSLMFGGEINSYYCKESETTECLNVGQKKITISKGQSIVDMVKVKLDSIVKKIKDTKSNVALSESEIAFIQKTSLPIYKMLNVQAAYSKGISALDMTNYTEIIASDILFVYLEESIQEVLNSARTLQLPAAEYNQFINNIEEAKNNIRNRKSDVNKQYTLVHQMINQTMQLEQRLSMRMQDNLKSALTWSAS